MSKSSQRKLSMYQLGRSEALRYKEFNRNWKCKCKDYMRGWNSIKMEKKKMKADTAMILFTVVMFIILVPFLIWGKP